MKKFFARLIGLLLILAAIGGLIFSLAAMYAVWTVREPVEEGLSSSAGILTKTLETTLSHIDKLKKSVLFLFCGMRIYPHTALFDLAVRQGRLAPSSDLLEPVFYQSADIQREQIIELVTAKAAKRIHWVIGSGGDENSELVKRMYAKGYSGPLWEYLIR